MCFVIKNIADPFQGSFMSEKYFNKLNYSMANEDSEMERRIVKKLQSKKVLSVCGSGSRALTLLSPIVEKLDCIDLSEAQLGLAALRVELIKELELDDYLKFWGYSPYSPEDNIEFRKETFKALSFEAKEIIEEIFEVNEWTSLLYKGKWENSFSLFGKAVKFLFGSKAHNLFKCENLDEQQAYLKKGFPWKRWNFVIRVIGNRATFNALLYKGDFIKKNIPMPYFDYYSKAFNTLFANGLARDNFFVQLCMLGKIEYKEGSPIETNSDCFGEMKESLNKLTPGFKQKDIVGYLEEQYGYDYISFSDVPSYFSGELEKNFLQKVRPSLAEDGVVVIRSYLRIPEVDRTGYTDITYKFKDEIEQEKTQMYRVEVLQKS